MPDRKRDRDPWDHATSKFEHLVSRISDRKEKYRDDPVFYQKYAETLINLLKIFHDRTREYKAKHKIPLDSLPENNDRGADNGDIFDAVLISANKFIQDIVELEGLVSKTGSPEMQANMRRMAKLWSIEILRHMRNLEEKHGKRKTPAERGRRPHRKSRRGSSRDRERNPRSKGLMGKLAARVVGTKGEVDRRNQEARRGSGDVTTRPSDAHYRSGANVLLADIVQAYKYYRKWKKEENGNIQRAREERERGAQRRRTEQVRTRQPMDDPCVGPSSARSRDGETSRPNPPDGAEDEDDSESCSSCRSCPSCDGSDRSGTAIRSPSKERTVENQGEGQDNNIDNETGEAPSRGRSRPASSPQNDHGRDTHPPSPARTPASARASPSSPPPQPQRRRNISPTDSIPSKSTHSAPSCRRNRSPGRSTKSHLSPPRDDGGGDSHRRASYDSAASGYSDLSEWDSDAEAERRSGRAYSPPPEAEYEELETEDERDSREKKRGKNR